MLYLCDLLGQGKRTGVLQATLPLAVPSLGVDRSERSLDDLWDCLDLPARTDLQLDRAVAPVRPGMPYACGAVDNVYGSEYSDRSCTCRSRSISRLGTADAPCP